MDKEKIIVTCGIFNPLTLRDLKFLERCRKKGNWLIVGLHSDFWLMHNKKTPIQEYPIRREMVLGTKWVDEVITFSDSDGTVSQLLKIVKIIYPDSNIHYISEQDMHNMPETKIRGITFETMK